MDLRVKTHIWIPTLSLCKLLDFSVFLSFKMKVRITVHVHWAPPLVDVISPSSFPTVGNLSPHSKHLWTACFCPSYTWAEPNCCIWAGWRSMGDSQLFSSPCIWEMAWLSCWVLGPIKCPSLHLSWQPAQMVEFPVSLAIFTVSCWWFHLCLTYKVLMYLEFLFLSVSSISRWSYWAP